MQKLEFIQIPTRTTACGRAQCGNILPGLFIFLQRTVVVEIGAALLDRLGDVGQGIVNMVRSNILLEIGKDQDVVVASQFGQELSGEFLVYFVRACFDNDLDIIGVGEVTAANIELRLSRR